MDGVSIVGEDGALLAPPGEANGLMGLPMLAPPGEAGGLMGLPMLVAAGVLVGVLGPVGDVMAVLLPVRLGGTVGGLVGVEVERCVGGAGTGLEGGAGAPLAFTCCSIDIRRYKSSTSKVQLQLRISA